MNGEPKGEAFPCDAEAYDRISRTFRRCSRKGVVAWKDGKYFCRQHHPDSIRGREDERHARRRAEDDEMSARIARLARSRRDGEDALSLLRGVPLPSVQGDAAEFYGRFYSWYDRARMLLARVEEDRS